MTKICKNENCSKEAKAKGLCRNHYYRHRYHNRAVECSIAECDRNEYAKGYCSTHYENNRLTGNPLITKGMVKRAERIASLTDCTAEGCGRLGEHRGMCSTHYQRWTWTEEARGQVRAYKQAEKVEYAGAHNRVRRARGIPAGHKCVDCGAVATDWSLNADADIQISSRGVTAGCLYSSDPDDYDPRCRACHDAYDSKHGLKRKGLPENYEITLRPETRKKAERIVELIKDGNTITETGEIVGAEISQVSRLFTIVMGVGIREWKRSQKAGAV